MSRSYLVYDFETDGVGERTCRPLQVAWQRFDTAFTPIADPVNLLIKPAPDRLPHPDAIAITGISLEQCARDGVSDAEAFHRLHAEMTTPGTCSCGWNTRGFDTEVLRFGFWRNFLPAYDHEFKHDCDAWDLLPLARAACALRPDGITWPRRDDSVHVFKLDRLAPANGCSHEDAHDALADVDATVHMARLFMAHQPDLWKWARKMADTAEAARVVQDGPFVHVSGRIPAARHCLGVFGVVGKVPGRKNEVIAWDLAQDPARLQGLDTKDIQDRTFRKAEQIPNGEARLPLKTIKLNAAPFVAPLAVLRPQDTERLQVDLDAITRHAAALADVAPAPVESAFQGRFEDDGRTPDPDDALYGGGFAGNRDLATGRQAHTLPPEDLHMLERQFSDQRFKGLLQHFIARNHPAHLSAVQREQWNERTRERLQMLHLDDDERRRSRDLSWDAWQGKTTAAHAESAGTLKQLLQELLDHGHRVAAAVGLSSSA